MSLDIKEVVQIAREQFVELLPDLEIVSPSLQESKVMGPATRQLKDIVLQHRIRLEELEREGENWAVTLSVPNPDFNPSALLEGIRNARSLARVAKVIVIDGEQGKLIALRERAA
jgi:hypothetical protein